MVKRIKKPSTPSNCVIYQVDHHTNLSQQTEERWLHSVIINSPLVFNQKLFSTLAAARSPATRVFCSCASLTRNGRSRNNLPGFVTIRVIRCSSSTTPMRCCVREFIRSPQATRTKTTPTHYAAIPPFKPLSVKPILWPLSPRSRVWRITPMSKPSNGLAPLDFSGSCSMAIPSEPLPKKSYWTLMPPTIPATASKSLPSFTVNTASTCITRCFSSKRKLAAYSRQCFAPAMPRPQRESPPSLAGWFPSLSGASLKPNSAIGPMPARPLQRFTEPWNPSKCSMLSGSPRTRYLRKEPRAGLTGQRASMPAPKLRFDSSIAFATGPEAGTNNAGSWSRSKSALWAPMSALSSPTARVEPNRSMTAMPSEESARIGSKNLSAILAPIGFPAIAIAPMLFDFNSMRSLTSCWCCSVSTPFEPPTSLMRGWKPYALSYSKWGLGLSKALATCGFISPQAGRDAIGLSRFGKTSSNSPSLCPVNLRSLPFNSRSRHSQQTDAGVSFQNAFSPRSTANLQNRGLHEFQNLHLYRARCVQ